MCGFFFFQAEDGIRDAPLVTGVQTCALPIFLLPPLAIRCPASSGISGTSLCIRSRITELTRSEEHTSELQSLMRISYAVFCLKKKKYKQIEATLAMLTTKSNNTQNYATMTQCKNRVQLHTHTRGHKNIQ